LSVTDRRITRPRLERTIFEASRAAEYFDARKLSTLTGVQVSELMGDEERQLLLDRIRRLRQGKG
jgi:hypothetical protein